jgi:hypothetical protein
MKPRTMRSAKVIALYSVLASVVSFSISMSYLLCSDGLLSGEGRAEKRNFFLSYMATSEVTSKIAPSIPSVPSTSAEVEDLYSYSNSYDKLNPAQQVWKHYQEWHGQDSLLRNPGENRTFVVGYYSCPNQAGNRFHDFLNSLIVAIATNRTFLWKYYDPSTCEMVHKGYNQQVCRLTNHIQVCDNILQRAEWLPSYDEWAPKLGLPLQLGPRNPDYLIGSTSQMVWEASKRTLKMLHQNQNSNNTTNSSRGWQEQLELLDRHPSRETQFDHKVIQTSREWFLDSAISKQRLLHELNQSRNRRASQLFSNGPFYLYGMLFHDLFTLRSATHTKEASVEPPQDAITIAMHVRHIFERNKGGKLTKEQRQCLRKVVHETRGEREDAPCIVYLMSDRRATLNPVTKLANQLNCSTVVASHREGDATGNNEHGPYAGLGFYQDLVVAGKARDGFVGHCHRSSSQMLLEAIHVGRKVDEWKGKPPAHYKLSMCCNAQ